MSRSSYLGCCESFEKYLKNRFRRNRPEVFLGKCVLKICSKFTGGHSFIEITLWHACSLAILSHIFRTPFPKNTSERLLLKLSEDK